MLRVQNGQLVIDESAGVSVAYKPGDMYGYPVRCDHIPNPEGNQSVVPMEIMIPARRAFTLSNHTYNLCL